MSDQMHFSHWQLCTILPLVLIIRYSLWQKCFVKSDWNDWGKQKMSWLTSRTLPVPWSCFIAACRSASLTWGNSSTPLWIRKHLNPATPAWTIGLSSSWDGQTDRDGQADKQRKYCYFGNTFLHQLVIFRSESLNQCLQKRRFIEEANT